MSAQGSHAEALGVCLDGNLGHINIYGEHLTMQTSYQFVSCLAKRGARCEI